MLDVVHGDITRCVRDAIVNAANSSLMGGGGVDGAIHKAAGPELLAFCREIRDRQGKCATGDAVITGGASLPAGWVIHAVGPVWRGGESGEPALLRRCYHRSLELARAHACRSVAFPNISTGIYGYPKQEAAEVAIAAVRSFPELAAFERISFVCFDLDNLKLYRSKLAT